MAVIVVGTKEAFVIESEQGLSGDWFIEPIRDHARFKVIVAKCGRREIPFYRNMIRDAVAIEGRVERILQHFERQSIDVIVVERDIAFLNIESIRYIGGERDYSTTLQQIVRVDQSIDAEVVQRALDSAAKDTGVDFGSSVIEACLNQLLALGVLEGQLKKIEY